MLPFYDLLLVFINVITVLKDDVYHRCPFLTHEPQMGSMLKSDYYLLTVR